MSDRTGRAADRLTRIVIDGQAAYFVARPSVDAPANEAVLQRLLADQRDDLAFELRCEALRSRLRHRHMDW